jgi:sulfoxide reductase heme-binding subunit YedZ
MFEATQERIFQVAAREKVFVYRSFLALYTIILMTLVAGGVVGWYGVGVWMGRAAVSVLAAVLIPGMLGRFGIQIKVTRIITFYRRQLGITTFLLTFSHGILVRVIPRLLRGNFPFATQQLFELFGTLALSFMFLLFVTSNNTSVRRVGPWWKRLHRLVYVIVGLFFFIRFSSA